MLQMKPHMASGASGLSTLSPRQVHEHQLTGRDFKPSNKPIEAMSHTSFNQSHFGRLSNQGYGSKAGMGLAGAGAAIAGQSNATIRSNQPFSFKAAIDQLEEEIMVLKQEVSFARKEVKQLKCEQDTVEDVAKAQCNDIERYLRKEINILDDVIEKANKRQKAENSRFQIQISQVREISTDLNESRLECVEAVRRVEANLGIEVDPNESFQQPLHEKIGDSLMSRVDQSIIKTGLAAGIITKKEL